MPDFLVSTVRETVHRNDDDLLSAGLGLDRLRGREPPVADANAPTSAELRRRAIFANWRGIADFGPLGGYGTVYGAVPNVPGVELQAFARVPGAQSPHRVLIQIPDNFDLAKRCVIVAPSSGSRGIYGAIAFAGAWALPRGFAVAYTDKGGGSGYFDGDSRTGVALDGTRAEAGSAMLEFEPGDDIRGVAPKHTHSGDNPEADWGRHVLQAAHFALAMLDRAFPQSAPFTAQNTRIIAAGLSNGGGAVLQAAGLDRAGLLAGVVALEPNVLPGEGGRALYDYATDAALLHPPALMDSCYDAVPFARSRTTQSSAEQLHRRALAHAAGIDGADDAAIARVAHERLRASGWTEVVIETAASTTAFDVWRGVGAVYSAAYLRSGAGAMPCDFFFSPLDAKREPRAATVAERALWWSDASGTPPGAGIELVREARTAGDATLGAQCLRELWTNADRTARQLRESIDATRAQLPRSDLPIVVVHGVADGLVPEAFSSIPYVEWLRRHDRGPTHWRVQHAQHFDAFLALPGFGDRYVPLLPYGYRALDAMAEVVAGSRTLPPDAHIAAQPRGATPLTIEALSLPK